MQHLGELQEHPRRAVSKGACRGVKLSQKDYTPNCLALLRSPSQLMSFTLRPFASAALLLSLAGLCAGPLLAAEPAEPAETAETSALRARPLVLGVVETAEPSFDDNTVRPVLKAMQSAAPGTQIDVVRLSSATFEVAVAQLKPDLVISPAADFLRIVDSIGAHPIGTRKTKYAKHPSKSAGGAVIALASRTDIQKLTDLRGKQIAATLPTSVDGMLAVRMELAEQKFDNRHFFRSVRYLGYSMPNVIEGVLSGHFDAGVVPVCTLELIEAEDLIERGALRVISPKSDDDTVCAHTSELYPDLVAATFSWTDPELTRLTTSTLLASKSADAEFNWYGTSDFHRIRALEETLQIGPWAYLQEMTPEALWRRWRFAVFAVLAGLGLLLLNEWRLRRLVAKRTGELKRSMEERDRLAQRERAVRDRLSSLERMGAISQLCAMIAHELKQPVGAVINYVAVVKLKLGLQTVPGLPGETALNASERPVDPLLLRALAGAEGEAHRIAAIVDRVRSYARRQHAEPVPVDIVRETQNALRSLKAELRPFVVIRPPFSLTADDASKGRLIIRGDPLDIELLLLNVMKNAAEAVQGLPDGAVLVKFRREILPRPSAEHPAPSPAAPPAKAVIVEVEDNGPRLSDEAFERLTRVSQSVKDEGLGLGLGIVRSLVEENGGRIAITRREDLSGRGLRVTLCFDLDAEGLKAQSVPYTDPADYSAAQAFPKVSRTCGENGKMTDMRPPHHQEHDWK